MERYSGLRPCLNLIKANFVAKATAWLADFVKNVYLFYFHNTEVVHSIYIYWDQKKLNLLI